MKLGQLNTLRVNRHSPHGFYLADEQENEVLLPNGFVPDELKEDDDLEVFIYRDSEDRLIATTWRPHLLLGEIAMLRVRQINNIGAFLDWGLPKDLLVPYSEQPVRLRVGDYYPVILLLDEKTDRLIGSARIQKNLQAVEAHTFHIGDQVDLFIWSKSDLGLRAAVNGKYPGLVFHSDVHQEVRIGERLPGYVKQVRDDGKLDLALQPMGYHRSIDRNTEKVIEALLDHDGEMNLHDRSDPAVIKQELGLSKKAFKRVVGHLYKSKLITLHDRGISLTARGRQTFVDEEE